MKRRHLCFPQVEAELPIVLSFLQRNLLEHYWNGALLNESDHSFRYYREISGCLREYPAASRYRFIGVHSAKPRSLWSAFGGPPVWRKRMANMSRNIVGVRQRSSRLARAQSRRKSCVNTFLVGRVRCSERNKGSDAPRFS